MAATRLRKKQLCPPGLLPGMLCVIPLLLMTCRLSFQHIFFHYKIRMEECAKYHSQGNQGCPNGFSDKEIAEYGSYHRAAEKEQQHLSMLLQFGTMRLVLGMQVPHLFCQADSDLSDMIRGKRRGHGNALCLAKGIILHRRNKINGYLGDLYRRRFRYQAQAQHCKHFYRNQKGIPTYRQTVLNRIWKQL